MQSPPASLLVYGGYLAERLPILDDHSRQQACAIAYGVDHLVLVDDATRIEILPAARLGALGVAYGYALQLLRAVVVGIAYLAVLVYLYAVVKHRSRCYKGGHAKVGGVSRQ